MTMRTVVVLGLLLIGVAACSREQRDWRSAQAADTLEAYDRFLELHSESELATQARTRTAQLAEERDWQRATQGDTAVDYRRFLTQYPNGKWAQEARIRLENFELTEVMPVADVPPVGPRTQASPTLSRPGESEPPLAQSSGTAVMRQSESYGIQLGAFSDEGKARAQWRALLARFGEQLDGLVPDVTAALTPAGEVYRLQAQIGDESRARAICAALTRLSQGCVVVLPRRADEKR